MSNKKEVKKAEVKKPEKKKNEKPEDVKNNKEIKKTVAKKEIRKRSIIAPTKRVPRISHSQTSRYHKSQGDLSYRYKMELLKRKSKRKRM